MTMADRIFVSTRKGLFTFVEAPRPRWSIERVSFLGDAVSIALHDPRDGALYAALGLGHYGVKLRRSLDRGATWTEVATPAFPKQPDGEADTLPDGKPWPWRVQQIWSLEAGGEEGALWCGTIGGGLFHSTDRGASWSLVEPLWRHPKRKEWFGGGADLPGIHSICVDPRDPRTIAVGVSCGGVWHTRDHGASWELGAKGMFAEYMPPPRRDDEAIQDPHRVARCSSAPDRLWAQHHNGVFRSDDGGRTWSAIPNVVPSVFGFAVAAHPHDPNTAWLVPAVKDETRVPVDGKVVVARTRDGGETWRAFGEGLPQGHAYDIAYRHALDVDRSGERLAFGSTTGSLWTSGDSGESWTSASAHLPPVYAVTFART
jgi:hypothetical protein